MAANKKLLFLPGDGIGPEVMGQVRKVIDWLDNRRHVSFELEEDLVGGAAIDAYGTSCPSRFRKSSLTPSWKTPNEVLTRP